MLHSHWLSQASLDTLAEGSSDPAIVGELRQAYRSRQLALLRAVLERTETLDETTGPLPSLAAGWALLADVQRRSEAAVDSVIMLPRTGAWTKEVLQLLDTGRVPASPLWTVVGYFHQMVVAAAIRAGQEFKWAVPVWHGNVLLPSLGLAEITNDDEWSVAEVWSEDGQVVIQGPINHTRLPRNLSRASSGWLPLRTLRMGERTLWLDDIDPYREFGVPLPPRRLSDVEVAEWETRFQEVWRLLTDHHPVIADELAAGLSTLVPCVATDHNGLYSASHNDAFGSVVLSQPPTAVTFAELLVHEFGHSKFGVLLSLVDLLEPDGDNETPRLYAPWRDDPRPAMGVLHGVYSFLGVTAFYRAHSAVLIGRQARIAQFEFEYHRVQTIQGAERLLVEADLSELGRRFLSTALRRLRAWDAVPLPADVREAARCANLDNHLCWRIRQLRPDKALVTALMKAWFADAGKPTVMTEPRLVGVVGDVTKARLTLFRAWLSEPERIEHYRASPGSLVAEIDGATLGDLALLDGDTERAVKLYQRQILSQPESPTNWAGLALASGEKALLTHPELVFAVHQEIQARSGGPVDPVRLVKWLA